MPRPEKQVFEQRLQGSFMDFLIREGFGKSFIGALDASLVIPGYKYGKNHSETLYTPESKFAVFKRMLKDYRDFFYRYILASADSQHILNPARLLAPAFISRLPTTKSLISGIPIENLLYLQVQRTDSKMVLIFTSTILCMKLYRATYNERIHKYE